MSAAQLPRGALFSILSHNRLWNFDRLVECVEDFVPHAKDQMLLRRRQELTTAQPHDVEYLESDLELVTLEWSSRYPAHFFGNLVVLLSGEVEIVMGDFTNQVKEAKKLLLAFKDIARPSPYSKLRKYVQVALAHELKENNMLDDLYFLRNLFAHHGGEASSKSEKQLRRVEAIIRSNPGLTLVEGYVVVQPDYLYAATDAALLLVRTLADIHPERGEPNAA